MARKLKILHIGKYYPPSRGGMETLLELMCQGLKDLVELEVVVASENNTGITESVGGVHVQRLSTTAKIAGAPICPGLWSAIRNSPADIVHIHLPNPVALMTYQLARHRSQLVCSYHSDIVRQKAMAAIIEPLQDRALARSKAIIASSPDLIESSPVLRNHRDRCCVIPFGIDLASSDQPDLSAVQQIRTTYGNPLLLAVGRLVYYKGFEFLIRAMAETTVPCHLLIIGDGPLRSQLEMEIASLGLAGRVHLLGNVPDTAPFYQACDVFVLPSVARSEAFGVVQLEAMACGKPVINTKLDTGVPFVSRHLETGLTVPPADVRALSQAIDHLLGDDHLRASYGAAASKRVHSEFTVERMVQRTFALYQTVSGS